jgi:alpha-mannosidase
VDLYADGDPPEAHRSLTRTHTYGSLPEEYSFCSVTPSNVVVSTIKQCEDDGSVVVRYFDMEGKDSPAELRFFAPVTSVERTNLIEEESTGYRRGSAATAFADPTHRTAKLTVPRRQAAAALTCPTDTMNYADQAAVNDL